MNKFATRYFLYFLLAVPFTFTSCQVVGDIFKAGMWVGLIGVVLVVALIVWIIGKIGR